MKYPVIEDRDFFVAKDGKRWLLNCRYSTDDRVEIVSEHRLKREAVVAERKAVQSYTPNEGGFIRERRNGFVPCFKRGLITSEQWPPAKTLEEAIEIVDEYAALQLG